ncbi:hypothetical protein ADH76_00150 [Enterocloster clostridioformis]|nr:hypothetical protein A4V08_04230 [Lachnoclostridium sp. YL32]OXE69934.1 hypothetical protein ADH76_00150 [Enterocloster clostridioformis]
MAEKPPLWQVFHKIFRIQKSDLFFLLCTLFQTGIQMDADANHHGETTRQCRVSNEMLIHNLKYGETFIKRIAYERKANMYREG